jgi:hypothetical protein
MLSNGTTIPGPAWACYLAAKREDLASLNAQEVRFAAAALRHEAEEKLSGWRSDAATAEGRWIPLPVRISALQHAAFL